MTKQETREKIVDIISEGILYGEDNYGMPTDKTIENIADALIAAGIVDKSDYASMKETAVRYKAEVSKAGAREKEAEHRAARAERALYLLSKSVHEFYMKTKFVGDYFVNDPKMICAKFLKQAEKELAEERRDD